MYSPPSFFYANNKIWVWEKQCRHLRRAFALQFSCMSFKIEPFHGVFGDYRNIERMTLKDIKHILNWIEY